MALLLDYGNINPRLYTLIYGHVYIIMPFGQQYSTFSIWSGPTFDALTINMKYLVLFTTIISYLISDIVVDAMDRRLSFFFFVFY